MGLKPPSNGMLKPVRRRLRPLRRWYEYQKRAQPTHLFRFMVTTLRALHLLPPSAVGDDGMRLLIVNLTPHLGDTIMVMPLIEALRKANPDARIEYATEESAAPLLRLMPELDRVYALPLGRESPLPYKLAVRRSLAVMRAYWQQMLQVQPTVSLLPRWGDDLFRSSVLAYLTGAPRRIGYAADVASQAPPAPYRDKLLTEVMRGGSGLHEPLRFALLAAKAGLIPSSSLEGFGMQGSPSLQRIAAAEDWQRLAERVGIDTSRPFAVIAPGASHPRRIWPIAQWAAVARALVKKDFQVVILAGQPDAALAEQLHHQLARQSILVAGSTTLVESTALLQHAKLFLGSDSGPGHIAGALNIPSVILFASTEAADPDHASTSQRVKPMGSAVVCCHPPHCLAPCERSCMSGESHCIGLIQPEDVLQAVSLALERQMP